MTPGRSNVAVCPRGKGRTAVAQVKVKTNKESGGTQRCEGCLLMCSCTGSSGVIRRVPRSQGQLSPRPMFYLHRVARRRWVVMGRTCSIMTKYEHHHGCLNSAKSNQRDSMTNNFTKSVLSVQFETTTSLPCSDFETAIRKWVT